jgi:predicted RNA binding protein YcfA (HicA-like mRNA interferase family)
MDKRDEIARFRQNPANVRFRELDLLLRACGFEQRKTGGSHFIYKRQGTPSLSVPFKRPIKEVYVRKALQFIEEYGDLDD